MNIILLVGGAWIINQIIKIAISKNINTFFRVGGTPSSHAALVGALSTAIVLSDGYLSTTSLLSYGLAAIVLHDALHLRKHHKLQDVLMGVLIGILGVLTLSML